MRYSVEWRDDASNAAPAERATVGDLKWFVAEQNITLHLAGLESVDHLTVALYGLAEGLAHDWWSLFGARDRTFSLVKYRDGFATPDITMTFDGTVFEVTANQKTYINPDVRFWTGPSEVMTRADAEGTLGGFVSLVLDRLDARSVLDTSAALRWARVRESVDDPEEAAFCEAAGAMGVDPYAVTERVALEIETASERFQGEPLTEFLAGARGTDRIRLVEWIDAMDRRPPYAARVNDLRAVALQAAAEAPHRGFEEGWSLGYRRARATRRVLGLEQADRFGSFRVLAEALGARRSYELAAPIDGLRALRSDKPDGTYIHMRRHGTSDEARASHLFSFARAVGDAVCFPAEARSAVNELRSAYRQAAGRAFAAEFLAPVTEVLSMRADGRDPVSMAEEFSVSTTVIERQLEIALRRPANDA